LSKADLLESGSRLHLSRNVHTSVPEQLFDVKLSPTQSDLRRAIEELRWWHTIDLPGGIRTPGHQRIEEQEFIARNIPQNLSGKTVLDVGANDGYFSFLAEKRNAAKVVAIDVFQGNEPDERVGIGEDGKSFLKTFALAKKALNSNVIYKNIDLFEIESLSLTFDVIFLFGVYYHLEDPVKGLRTAARNLNPGGLLLFEGLVRAGNHKPDLHQFTESEIEPTTFYSANTAWLLEAFHNAGLERVGYISVLRYKSSLLNLIVRLGWALGLNFGPYKRAHRAFITFRKPLLY
jgi:tRNA (mo5U34)-methyltransferase